VLPHFLLNFLVVNLLIVSKIPFGPYKGHRNGSFSLPDLFDFGNPKTLDGLFRFLARQVKNNANKICTFDFFINFVGIGRLGCKTLETTNAASYKKYQ
jgi:hypothetical protein